jgi:dipeptidyl aminopeptidase/acylaminoacyl peptidase
MRRQQTKRMRMPHPCRSLIATRVGYFVSIVLYSLLLLLPFAASSQQKRPMTFADMMQMRRLGATEVSPDGKWLIYSVTDVDLAKNSKTDTLWIQEIAGGNPKRLEGTEPGDSGVKFSHDGKKLLFLSSRNKTQQIFLADFDTARGATGIAQRASSIAQRPSKTAQRESSIQPSQSDIAQRPSNTAQDAAPRTTLDSDNALWAPDGKSIVFTAQVYPDCPAITPDHPEAAKCTLDRDAAQEASPVKARIFDHLLYRHWDHFTGDKRSHLFLLDLAAGGVRDLTPNDPHDVPPFSMDGGCNCAISPDSKELAFTENLDEEPAISTNSDIFTLDLTNPSAKPKKISTSPGGDLNPSYSPDGKYLAWRSQARAHYESDKFRLLLYDRQTKQTKDLLPNFDRWLDEFAWSPNSTRLYLVSGDQGAAPLYYASINTHDFVRINTFQQGRGEYSDLHPLSDGETLILVRTTMRQPAEIYKMVDDQTGVIIDYRIDKKWSDIDKKWSDAILKFGAPLQKTILPLTHLNEHFKDALDMSELESFDFKSGDKAKVQGFLIKPPGFDPAKKYPVKFLIHGGPQGAWGDAWSYRWNAELLAANGYVVIMINPRGSTGYGQAFVDGVNGDWGGKPFSDLMLGLDYAEKTYPFIDKNRECALGASYGGYMASWILGHTNRFKCIVTHDGMFNPESAYGTTDEVWFNEWEFKFPNTSGGKPWDYYGKPDSENPFRKWSPAMSAKSFKTPTLVIHSQLDYRLDVSEGYQLFTTLQRLKVPSKMLYFPDESHFVQKPQNSELWYKTVNAWVDQWTAQNRE